MNGELVELALKKQRLLIRSAALREQWIVHARGLQPAFSTADQVRDAGRWLAAHPQWLVGGAVALLVARPGAVFRWIRRSIVALGVWRRLRRFGLGLL
jgi:hypothetical protein